MSPPKLTSTWNLRMQPYLVLQGLCRYNQVMMKSYWIRMGPNSMTDILVRKFGHRDKHRVKMM